MTDEKELDPALLEDQVEPEELEEEQPEDGDEGDEGGEQQQQQSAQAPRTNRAQDRIQALREQARIAQQERDAFEARLRQYEQEHQQREAYYSQQTEQERLANMTVEERLAYQSEQALSKVRQLEQAQQFVQLDQNDKSSFHQYVAQVPEYQALAPQVEVELSALRSQYRMNVPRQLVLATLLGLKMMQAQAAAPQQRARGQENIRRQRAAPSQGQSDVQRRERKEKTPRDRLEGVVF